MMTGPGSLFAIVLWVSQSLLALSFASGGVMKLFLPVERISKIFPWTGQVPKSFLRFIGVVDLAGGIGVLVPRWTGILPVLSLAAAVGCALVQLLAIGFHARRGELKETPFNFFLLALSAFTVWGLGRFAG